jgi:cysteine desulfurase
MGLSKHRARASLRFSLSRLTTEDEIEAALAIVPAAVSRLRTLSPVYAAHAANAVAHGAPAI